MFKIRKYSILFLIGLLFPTCVFSQAKFLFVSDTQEPMEVERLFFIDEKNVEATDTLFSRILQQNPTAIFHLGDLVSNGAGNSSWTRIDTFLGQVKQQKIPFYPVMGNHEYMFNAKKGKKNFAARFPNQSKNIYSETIDSVAMVLFNSNFSKLSATEKEAVEKNYNQLMDSLQKEAGVKFIVVGTHYPAYTNSTVISASKEVLKDFVPKYINTSKAVLFLSGHCHNLEIFQEQGKYFCVIGGGGGINQPLKSVENQQVKEVLKDLRRFRFFYFTLERQGNNLFVKAHGMDPDDFSTEKSEEIFTFRAE